MPNKFEALSSNPNPTTKKQKSKHSWGHLLGCVLTY
jgi:hypothetical protein